MTTTGLHYHTVFFLPSAATPWRIPIAVVAFCLSEEGGWSGARVGIASFLPSAAALGGNARYALMTYGIEQLRRCEGKAMRSSGKRGLPVTMGSHFELSAPTKSDLAAAADAPVQWLVDHVLPRASVEGPSPEKFHQAADAALSMAHESWARLPEALRAELRLQWSSYSTDKDVSDPVAAEQLRALRLNGAWAEFVARAGGGVR